jgi:hypothetical protein
VTVSDSSTIDPVYEFLRHVQKITGAYRLEQVTEVEMFDQISRCAARHLVEAWQGERAHADADAVLRRWTGGTAA